MDIYTNDDGWKLTPKTINNGIGIFYILNNDLSNKLGKDMGMNSDSYINKRMTTRVAVNKLNKDG